MRRFLLGFGLVALLVAGALSYFADSDPDGLDSVAQRGCSITGTAGGERLAGDCIAQDARDHSLAGGPFADYTVGGDGRFTGLAGVLGVVGTFAFAAGLFWLLRRRPGSGAGTGRG